MYVNDIINAKKKEMLRSGDQKRVRNSKVEQFREGGGQKKRFLRFWFLREKFTYSHEARACKRPGMRDTASVRSGQTSC